jgi:hypothetical protein
MNPRQYACLSCDAKVYTLIDFGKQPPSNRFFRSGEIDLDLHSLVIGQCSVCMLLQLVNFMSSKMVKPRFDWIHYSEPEGHLDMLMERVTQLPGITESSYIAGFTYEDDTSITRLNKLGFTNTFRLDSICDLDLNEPITGLEAAESLVSEGRAEKISSRRGQVDLLIVRYVLEHVHDPRAFLAGLKLLVKPGGYIIFEVPDGRKFLDACDYSFVWEEHITYFVPVTIRAFFEVNRFFVHDVITCPYPLEDSLVCIVKIEQPIEKINLEYTAAEFMRAQHFSAEFTKTRQRFRDRIAELHSLGKKIAVFGAGHLAVKFLNLYDLGDLIDCVIDDSPHKQGMLMPGSGLPIFSSKLLDEGQIDVCLLSLSPASEKKVLASKKAYLDKGGKFFSIFILSQLAL